MASAKETTWSHSGWPAALAGASSIMPSAGSRGSKASRAGLVTGRPLLVGVALTAAIVRADRGAEPEAPLFADAGRLAERAFEFAIGDVSSEIGTTSSRRQPNRGPPGPPVAAYLAKLASSFWMAGVQALAGWLPVSVQMPAVR